MSEDQKPFNEKRRQQFIYEGYYSLKEKSINEFLPQIEESLRLPEDDKENDARLAGLYAQERADLFSLRYTAGAPLDQLRTDFTQVVEAYERYAKYLREYHQEPGWPVFSFTHRDDYVRALQLLSLAVLLHREDLITRTHSLIVGSGYDEADALYEEILGKFLPNRPQLDAWYFEKPYRHLLDVIDDDTPTERLTDLNRYLKAWYPNMQGCGWYNTHEHMSDEGGGYFGYWAFEAGAVAFLLDIDDSSIDHMVYPKDLVAYARKLRDEGVASPTPTTDRLRAEPNDLVPKTGWWHSTAKPNGQALHYFEAGQRFPDWHTTSYGSVIWGYDPDEQKEPPKR